MTAAMIDGPAVCCDIGLLDTSKPAPSATTAASVVTGHDRQVDMPVPSLLALFGNQPASRYATQDRLVSLLDGWIVVECRLLIARHLTGLTDVARAAMLPGAPGRMSLARRVLAELQPAALLGLLSVEVETERALLLHQAGSLDPMLREAALDALSGIGRTRTVTDRVREGCMTLLAPGFALLGVNRAAGPTDAPDDGRAGSASASEAAVLEALQRDDLDAVVRILALHAGIDPVLVADAVWTRDSRSLFGLAWRAGYSTRAAMLLQAQLAGVPPASVLVPGENSINPMSRSEIAWQLAMLEQC